MILEIYIFSPPKRNQLPCTYIYLVNESSSVRYRLVVFTVKDKLSLMMGILATIYDTAV
jgi:hypothetical protein